MNVLLRSLLLFVSFYSISIDGKCQGSGSDGYKKVIVFNEIYQSHLVELGGNYYDNIYLLTSDKPIDSLLFTLSHKHYGTMEGLLDTLKSYFKVFVIKRNVSKTSADKVTEILKDANHYMQGYLFFMDDKSNERGAVRYYIIKQHAFCNIQYTILNQKGGDFNREDAAIINKIERCP